MVGEGVLLACLDDPRVQSVLVIARRASGHTHPKLSEALVPDFRDLTSIEDKLPGYDACFYCAGVSSVGMTESAYTTITYETPLKFAEALLRHGPSLVFVHVSGAHTDGSERGKVMWARVKGRAENALLKLPFKGVYNVRPSLMKPVPGQRHVKRLYRIMLVFYPLLNLIFTGLTLRELARAMLACAEGATHKPVLEAADLKRLAAG